MMNFIKRWRMRRLKRRIIMKLLSNPNVKPNYRGDPEYAYRMIRFIYDDNDCGEYIIYEN